jgi:hypothetical protein
MSDPLQTVGGSFSKDEKTGLHTIRLKFIVNRDGGDEPWAILDSWIPASLPLTLPMTLRNSVKRDDGDWDLELTFEGVPDDQVSSAVADKQRVELDFATVEDPIESFQQFPKLRKAYKGTLTEGNAGSVIWPETLDNPDSKFIGPVPQDSLPKNPLFGVSHYLNPSAVLRITRVSPSFDPAVFRNLGKIDFPDITDAQWLLIKDVPDDRNWLKKSVRTSLRGNVVEVTSEWLLSGPGGWLKDIYGPKV